MKKTTKTTLTPAPRLCVFPSIAKSTAAPAGQSRDFIHDRLLGRLQRLDAEQMQVVELVIAAISRGAIRADAR